MEVMEHVKSSLHLETLLGGNRISLWKSEMDEHQGQAQPGSYYPPGCVMVCRLVTTGSGGAMAITGSNMALGMRMAFSL